jgi:hypothetical protein
MMIRFGKYRLIELSSSCVRGAPFRFSVLGQPRPAIENAQEAESSFAAQELAELVAREAKFPIDEPEHARRDLWRVASYYARRQREDLEDYLKEVFEKRATLGPLHRQLAANEPPLLLITTNFDTLLEQAFNEIKRDYDLVISRGPKVEHRRVQYRAPGAEDFKDFEELEEKYLDGDAAQT